MSTREKESSWAGFTSDNFLCSPEQLAAAQGPHAEWRGEDKLTEGPLVGIYATSQPLPDFSCWSDSSTWAVSRTMPGT